MSQIRTHLLLIDPQLDFCDCPDFAGSLAVPGAHADMQRIAALLRKSGHKLDDIHVTLDSHHVVDIAHPIWWRGPDGQSPAPFTSISAADIEAGRWQARNPAYARRSLEYAKALEASGRYTLTVWPEHCIIGTRGHNIHPDVAGELLEWDRKNFAMFETVTKGSNMFTEHYSGVQAEVPDPEDPSTMLNSGLINTLRDADLVLIAGEALSHCVANTVLDIAAQFGPENVSKLALLSDASSPVPGFEAQADAFLSQMAAAGMRTLRCCDF